MIDLRQTQQYAKYMNSLGWNVEEIDDIYIYLKKIPLLGWYGKLQRPSKKINLDNVYKQLIQKYNLACFLIEPLVYTSHTTSFKQTKSISLPSKTLQIDLTKSEQKLLSEMKQKTRYNIKLAQKSDVKIEMSKDINSFLDLWHKTSLSRGGMLPAKKEIKGIFNAFDPQSYLLFAYKENKLVAGVFVACSPDTAYYLYAASNKEGKRLFAPTLLAWEAISEAKKRKLKVFDFDGIYDVRFPKQTKAWIGFTKFKEGFGGETVEFPSPISYYKYSFLKNIL
jgi:lipid II:glycine glycyltransferase (peptidoglycan interpeptide bridge formation enzyme)